jgi:hypothetical protein
MTTPYRGPHVEVRQVFEVSPGAVAIENLPPSVIGTAYDVYAKEVLGVAGGIIDNEMSWPAAATKVLYNRSIAGRRNYDFYPVSIFADTSFGYIQLDKSASDITADGVTISTEDSYTLPNTEKVVGGCVAILPYYKKTTTVQILASDLQTVIITNGSVVTAKLKPGQNVFVKTGGNYVQVGVVGSIGTDETKIRLATPYTAAITNGTDIVVGAANTTNEIDRPNVLYDSSANFISAKVRVGDIVFISSLSISGTTTATIRDNAVQASITAVIDKNTIRYNTVTQTNPDYDYSTFKAFNRTVAATASVYTYWIERLVGFAQNYGLEKLIHDTVGGSSTGVMITVGGNAVNSSSSASPSASSSPSSSESPSTSISPSSSVSPSSSSSPSSSVSPSSPPAGVNQFNIPDHYHYTGYDNVVVPALSKGDIIEISETNWYSAVPSNYRRSYVIDSIVHDTTNNQYTITTVEDMVTSGDSTPIDIATGHFLHAWNPKVQTNIVADFRSVRTQELGVVHRIGSVKDVADLYTKDGVIDIHNDLAFMGLSAFSASGGRVIYMGHVDATAGQTAEYTAILEEMKVPDCYSTVFGTTDAGVNALMAPYVNEQSDPYEGHERVGILTYDEDDVLLQGSDTGTLSGTTKIVTITGAFNPITAGVTVSDLVKIYDTDGEYIETVKVVETPTVATQVKTDYDGDTLAGYSFRFICGRKDAQAIMVSALGAGDRRIKVIWPGWFTADYNGTTYTLPPYYISAVRAGMDCGVIVSQSMTNYDVGLPGISNIQLNTNVYYRKADLDEIGGGGIDVQIQDSRVSQIIKSRHDLTTNMDAVEYREWSITKQADVAAKTIRKAVNPYIGKYNITDNLINFLYKVCNIVCTKLMKDGVLAKISVKSIARDDVIADKVNFTIEATVFVAGNYYDITLYVKSR